MPFTRHETLWNDAPALSEVAARRGDSYRVWLGPWLVEPLRSGNVTYLHFPTMRGLAGYSVSRSTSSPARARAA